MIRKYDEHDIEVVVSTWRRASELAHPFLTKAFLDQEDANMRNIYLAFAETWVIEIDGVVVGFIALIEDEIGGLFLDPDFHGQGLGRALVDKAVIQKGPLKVEVFKENIIGRRFYDAYGFRETEEFIHEASGQTTLRMNFAPA
ncbi:MAG: GNAT family N-acetyltransferase [Alphaproteobacteria bacterium]|jgi:putative acetyltransferase|nr:GNAT family N-acetyltransferase [Alphaproteobacteria bacterium]MBT4019855.1 GNAT family N-acetyltransferase [Alphaproteobacteria bacterium]MBT4966150.1 GNAT family N-acetyltransferase [Alphaproteobacteria bacterium]MBT5158657.1 GNAT family N-acetyltransferase [Alphaproteobacteria bacterium]MBT6388109.1 GNAT family N-acetyltransferase [Alphaproteobacteria bacterium]